MRGAPAPMMDEIAAALSPTGLVLRGGFNFGEDEASPEGLCGAARSALLIGNAGAAYWQHFRRWREKQPIELANPLDSWCREIIGDVGRRFGARTVSPSDKPYLPFQRWAMRAEGLRPSPLGILMHPEYGLWHAYRGALLFDEDLPIETLQEENHLCDACFGKPCIKACPVDAYSETSFDHRACLKHVRGASGTRCRSRGCLDRNACPYGVAYRYPAEVQAFHMAAFAAL